MRSDDIANVVGKCVDVLFYNQRIAVLAKQICDQIFDCCHNRRSVSDSCFPTHRQPLVEQLLSGAMPSLRGRYLSDANSSRADFPASKSSASAGIRRTPITATVPSTIMVP